MQASDPQQLASLMPEAPVGHEVLTSLALAHALPGRSPGRALDWSLIGRDRGEA